MTENLELVSLFKGSIGKVLNFLLTTDEENSKSEIARKSDVTFKTVCDIWPTLEKYEIVLPTRIIGMAKLYALNNDSNIVNQLRKIKKEVVNHNNHKGTSGLLSVYGLLVMFSLPLLGTLYLDSNDSIEPLVNITTVYGGNETNFTEVLTNATPEQNISEPVVNITTVVPEPIAQEPVIVETMVEEVRYEHSSIVIGEKVLWNRIINTYGGDNYSINLNLPFDYRDLAIVDTTGNFSFENGTLILSGNHTIEITFTTSPVQQTEEIVSHNPYQKKVTIASNSSIHYSNVRVSADIPEKKILTITELPDMNIDNKPAYNVTYTDADGNGLVDKVSWTVPQLSTKEYLIQENQTPKGKPGTGISFDRGLDCDKCGQHKAPPLAIVNMTVSASFDETFTDANFSDYFPNDWWVVDYNGGIMEAYNSSYNKISWHYDSIAGRVSQWYLIVSPALTKPPTQYDFFSGLASQLSDPWNVMVSDAYTLAKVNIYNVSNTYRGDTQKIICGATVAGASGGNAAFTLGLQYANGSTGNWIWVNVTNIALNVSQTDGNPQSFSGKVAFNKSFTVLALRNGTGNTFRCNGTDGTLNNLSTTSAMTILTPNLLINETNTSTAAVSADDANDLNVTCSVTTGLGNASSVHVYLKWNSSTNATWTDMSTISTNALYAGVATPQLYSNVVNSTTTALQTYQINAHTTGTYWFNCTTNSSLYDGRFVNTTSAYPLTVQPTGWLNVSYQNPATGNSQNVNQFNTFNVSAKVTCVGGPCGSVNGTLRYNNSAVLNPDTNVNITTGGTPFYVLSARGAVKQFNEVNISSISVSVNGVAIGDANNDGNKDVVIGTSATTNELRMYENKSGTWVETNITDYVGASNVNSVAIGDADNEGMNEIVVVSGFDNKLRMYKNISGGWVETNISITGAATVRSVAIGDADNNGKNEIVIWTTNATCAVRAYTNASGAWVETVIAAVSSINGGAIGDANNDGKNETVVGMTTVTNKVRMYENETGTWVETNISDPGDVYSVAIGDADNGGNNKVVTGLFNVVNKLRMYENKTGTWVETNIGDLSGSGPIAPVVIGDANNDGNKDVVIGTYNITTGDKLNEFRMYEYMSGWVETNISDFNQAVAIIAIGDANNDNKNEIVIGLGGGQNAVRMYYDTNSINPISCGSLSSGQTCSLNWTVNATGSSQYWLDVNFTSSLSQTQANDSGNFQINITTGAETTPPNIRNWAFNVSNMTNYSATQGYQFNVTVTDTTAVDDVWIEHNFSGILKNYTVTGNVGSSYYYNNASLAAGFYYVKWYANDTGGYLNNTDLAKYYQVNKSYLPLTLRINGTNADSILYNNSNANFTANFSSSYAFSITLYTNLTGTMTLWDTQNSPLMNYTILNPYQTRTGYIIIANFSNQNYTLSWANHSLELTLYISILNVTILNVTNNYRGDTAHISCNATSLNGNVAANVTLQFQNATGWYTLNTSYAASKVAYSTTEGTNPRYGVTVTTAGALVNFDVFSNITGSAPTLRCNVTVGLLSSATYNLSSTGSYSILTPPLNTSITTDVTPPISLYDDQSNNFNLTCNITALIGNVSSATLYAQWNSTLDSWNNTNTTGGPLRANESSPIVFSNIDNSTPQDNRVFLITGYTTGNYAVRCFANSSANDGSNQNWTNSVAVSVSTSAVSSLSNVTINNVTNNYRGDTAHIYCNATAVVGSVTANVTLQFQNATGWYTLNTSFAPFKATYDATEGTNPRFGVTVTTAGTLVNFDVFSNITGTQSLRCNVTQGLLSSSTVNTSSTGTYTINTPLLNTSIVTVPAGPLTIIDNQSNNFNLTCNVTALAGNASFVAVYAQWNDTNNIWNNFSTGAGSMRSNESSPIVFSNVDNSTPQNNRVFLITGYTAGNYSVRCFANSSANDGSNQNWTGITVVNVTHIPYVTPISPANGTTVDRDSMDSATADFITLTVATSALNTVNITFKTSLTDPSIGGQTNIILGYNTTNSSGIAVFNWNPNVSQYAGNYTWWAESNETYTANGTRTVLVYGGFNLTFQNPTTSPDASYVIGNNVKINATLKSLGPETTAQISSLYSAGINSTVIKEDASFAQINLTYSSAIGQNWTGNYTITDSDPLSGNSYNVSLNATANYFFANNSDFNRSFNVLTNVTISITISGAPIDYTSLDPGITSNASTAKGFPMIVSVDSGTNVNVDIFIKSNDTNMSSGANYILVGNQTFANNSAGTGNKTLTTGFQLLQNNISAPLSGPGTNVSCYWWIAVPAAQPPGLYTNTIIVYSNQSG
jgi:hypothetical protein